jgi:hypothetical protein
MCASPTPGPHNTRNYCQRFSNTQCQPNAISYQALTATSKTTSADTTAQPTPKEQSCVQETVANISRCSPVNTHAAYVDMALKHSNQQAAHCNTLVLRGTIYKHGGLSSFPAVPATLCCAANHKYEGFSTLGKNGQCSSLQGP